MTSSAGLQVELVSDLAAVAALRPDWEALEKRVPEATGFQSFAWCHLWLATSQEVAPDRVRPRIVIVRADGRLVMIWPLEIVRWFGLHLVRCIGGPMTQYSDALAEPGLERPIWRMLAEREILRWRGVDLVVMSRLREDAVLKSRRADFRPIANEEALYIDLSASSTVQRIAKDRSLRRRERRLAAHGPITFEAITEPNAKAAATRQCVAFKTAWLRKKRLFSTGLTNPASRHFLENLALDTFLEVHVLRAGAATVAIELGFVEGASYRSFMSAYNLDYADGSPGHALTSILIQRCCERGLLRFDLLAPADPYKRRWSDARVVLERSIYVLTWRGHVGIWLVRIRPILKRVALLASRGPDFGGLAPEPQVRIRPNAATLL